MNKSLSLRLATTPLLMYRLLVVRGDWAKADTPNRELPPGCSRQGRSGQWGARAASFKQAETMENSQPSEGQHAYSESSRDTQSLIKGFRGEERGHDRGAQVLPAMCAGSHADCRA